MHLTFLSAEGTPLAKTFTRAADGALITTPYPMVKAFTSISETADDLDDFAALLLAHGRAGHCLLKGNTNRPLTNESRAGSTDPTALTDWLCLDLDGAPFTTPQAFLDAIGMADTSYVLQWSASAGMTASSTLRCHLFVQLSRPTHPARIKLWLTNLNLSVPLLTNATNLTRTGVALRWPLDVTTCQNDKLLYIAPPVLGPGLRDAHPTDRVRVFHLANRTFDFPDDLPLPEAVRVKQEARINTLRAMANLPKRKAYAFKIQNGIEFLTKPGVQTVTSLKQERGFTYLNLNGGDSFAYWHPDDNYEFIHNFKGEPVYLTSELVPAYYEECKERELALRRQARANDPKIYLAFRDFDSGQYWNGFYDQSNDTVTLAIAKNENQIQSFLALHDQPQPEHIPVWQRVFAPRSSTVIDRQALPFPTINIFQPSDYMREPPRYVTTVPPLCDRIFRHVIGDDDEIQDHWHNWCACLFQHLDRNFTGWVWHGTQGTGKGLVVNRILSPLLGPQNTTMKRMEELAGDFTGFFENVFLVVIDEIQTSSSLHQAKIAQKLKNLMVEPTISIRRMYRESYMAPNFCNMIFTSNTPDPVVIAPDDRRFNVGNFQRTPLAITEEEIAELDKELPDIYGYWMTYPADRERAKQPLRTQAREDMIQTSMSSGDAVAQALLNGDMKFLADQLPTDTHPTQLASSPTAIFNKELALTLAYYEIVKEVVHTAPSRLTRDQLMTIFRYCVGNVPTTPNKFTAYLRHHQLHTTKLRINGANPQSSTSVMALRVNWQIDQAWLAAVRPTFI